MRKLIAGVLAVATVASMSVASMASWVDGTISDEKMTFVKTCVSDATLTATYTAGLAVLSDVRPAKTIYMVLPTVDTSATPARLIDKDMFNFKYKKVEGSKMVKSVKLMEKDPDKSGTRVPVIEIKLNEDMTDKETKVEIDFSFTAKDAMNKAVAAVDVGSKAIGTVKFFVSNTTTNADHDFAAGDAGTMLKPTKNEDNEIIWHDDNFDIAKVNFSADSDVAKFFPKLSTKWDNPTYAAKFADQNAFIFDFVGNPAISSTSRPVLTIYNPYVNEDGELTVAIEDMVIYQVIDDEWIDVSDKFTASVNDDGDEVLTTKTRTLGTYVIAEAAIADVVEEPATDKVNPGTGR